MYGRCSILISILHGLSTGSLTCAFIMDHLDWFTPGSKDVDGKISELTRVLSLGGFVLWWSAARQPSESHAIGVCI